MDSNFGTCRACGYRVRWIRTKNGKNMPCNPEAVRFTPGGGPETFVTGDGKVERGRRAKDGSTVGYISHFATCPQADRFRKRAPMDDYDQKRYSGLIEEGES